MGIKTILNRAGGKAADTVAKLSVLSPEQLQEIERQRENYLSQAPSVDDEAAEELTRRLLAASSIEIYNEYLQHIQDLYIPVKRTAEYDAPFDPAYNIRYFNITRWVTDKKENSLEKLVNVYEVLSGEECNIALVFHRTMEITEVYLAVTNTQNASSNVDVENYRNRLVEAIRGNFPGAEWAQDKGKGIIPCMKEVRPYSIASVSNVPGEKSEKFGSQTIEKLLDGIIPEDPCKEYTLVLLATPVLDVESKKLHLAEFYSGLAPYASWQTDYNFSQSDSTNSMATFGVNAGVSAGVQAGVNASKAKTNGVTDSEGTSETDSNGVTETDSTNKSVTDSFGTSTTDTQSTSTGTNTGVSRTQGISHSEGTSDGSNTGISGSLGVVGGNHTHMSGNSTTDMVSEGTSTSVTQTATQSASQSTAKSYGQAIASSAGKAIANNVGHAVANTLGRAVSNSTTRSQGVYQGVNAGGNFGANFARSSNVSATVGKNEELPRVSRIIRSSTPLKSSKAR